MDDAEKECISKLYPDKPNIYGPYTRKDNQRKMLVLCNADKKECITPLLARVRLEVKLGRRLVGDETVDHHDEDKTNDDPRNLELLSRSDNARKSSMGNQFSLGREVPMEQRNLGQSNGKAKLTDDQVLDFRKRYAKGLISKIDIQSETGLAEKTVRNFLFGDSYPHVSDAVVRSRRGRLK